MTQEGSEEYEEYMISLLRFVINKRGWLSSCKTRVDSFVINGIEV